MKKFLNFIPICYLCGCVTVNTYTQEVNNMANELEIEKKPIKTIQEYKEYKKLKCIEEKTESKNAIFKYTIFLPFGLIYDSVSKNFVNEIESACIKQKVLAESTVNFDCLESWRKGVEYYNSDECILYRRNQSSSKVNYFDYKRFLPKNTPVTTDEKFIKLEEFYDNIFKCYYLSEATSEEIESCIEERKNIVKKLASKEVKCVDLFSKEYDELLKTQGEWYNWAINHDPYALMNHLRRFGAYLEAQYAYEPILTTSEAKKRVGEKIKEFGIEHLCNTDDWLKKIRKKGYGI